MEPYTDLGPVLSGTYLLQLFNDHGECFEDGGGWTCQGYDSLRTIALGDVDASPTLQKQKQGLRCVCVNQGVPVSKKFLSSHRMYTANRTNLDQLLANVCLTETQDKSSDNLESWAFWPPYE